MYSVSLTEWGFFVSVFVEVAAMMEGAASAAAMWKDVKLDDADVVQEQWAGLFLKSRLFQFVSSSMHCV